MGQQIRLGGIHPGILHDPDAPWRAIADQIRQTGQRAHAGGDLVPLLAALRYNVQIRVLAPENALWMIGPQATTMTITLYRPDSDHRDATAPPPATLPPALRPL